MATVRGRGDTTQRVLPLGYMALAIALAVVLLPTALRPPPDQQNATASFSPDAPQDQPPEMLLQSIRRAQSSTAGAGSRTEIIEEEAPPPPPPPPPPKRFATRGRCFGDPPRQTESLYSALCVPAWTGGDNGGATSKGVTANMVKIGIFTTTSSTIPEGLLPMEFSETDSETTHDLKVWQLYFNERFEFYGRQLRFYIKKQSTSSDDREREAVAAVDAEGVFAVLGNTAAGAEEAIRRGIIDWGGANYPIDFLRKSFPYAGSFTMDSWQARLLISELICKQFNADQEWINERRDPTFNYDAPRKWGLIAYQDTARTGAATMYRNALKKCGIELAASQEYNLSDNQQSIGGSMAKMKAQGITSLILSVDGLTPVLLSQEAQNAQYWPEYFGAGTGGLDSGLTGRQMHDEQVSHMIGISPNEIPRIDEDKDWYRAYKEIDPDGDPDSSYFRSLQQISGGVQHAGPILTPQSFWQGLFKQPYRSPDPVWSIGGGYRDNVPEIDDIEFGATDDLTYMDYVSIIWMDHEGDDPDSDLTGTWCHLWEGRRFKTREMPTGPVPWFDDTQCITQPPKGVAG